MSAPPALFATCILAGCGNPSEPGRPCEDCVHTFDRVRASGWQLREGQPMTDAEVAERDIGVIEAYAMQRAAQVLNVEPPGGPQRKRNQMCWLCCERRTCTQQPNGWECDTCLQIT
jgi:hypothetical protein